MSESLPSPSKRHQLRFDAGPCGPEFAALCAAEGMKPQAMLQRLVAERVSAARGMPTSRRAVHGVVDGPKKRRELRFTAAELEILEEAAAGYGGSIREYVVAIAREHAKDASVGKEERLALARLNYQLSSIGRNVNQIAKRVNDFGGATAKQLEELALFSEMVRSIGVKIHAVLKSGRERWRIVRD